MKEKRKRTRRNLRKRSSELAEIRKMLKEFLKSMVELRKSIAELRESQKKTDEQMRATDERLEKMKMETLEQIRATDERLEKMKMETLEQIRATDERIEKRIGKLTDAQGLFWESLSEKGIIKFVEDEGYKIRKVARDYKIITKTGKEAEFDIIIEAEKNGSEEVFIAEVKTTATVSHVNEFLSKLSDIIEFFPEYEGRTIWGVFSSGRYADGTEKYAISKGLVVFGVSGEILVLLNPRSSLKPFRR